MGRVFNTTGVCIPEKHYMVNINGRLQQIKVLVDEGKYFTINRARQYGKTTTLRALAEMLRDEYIKNVRIAICVYSGISVSGFKNLPADG